MKKITSEDKKQIIGGVGIMGAISCFLAISSSIGMIVDIIARKQSESAAETIEVKKSYYGYDQNYTGNYDKPINQATKIIDYSNKRENQITFYS